jgi:hypothetical protein
MPPYLFSLDTTTLEGTKTKLRAFATDASGNRGRSAVIKVDLTRGEGLLVQKAKILASETVGRDSLKLNGVVVLPPGETLATLQAAGIPILLGVRNAAGAVVDIAVPAAAMSVNAAGTVGKAVVALPGQPNSVVKLKLKYRPKSNVHALMLSVVRADLGPIDAALDPSLLVEVTLDGSVCSESAVLRVAGAKLLVP